MARASYQRLPNIHLGRLKATNHTSRKVKKSQELRKIAREIGEIVDKLNRLDSLYGESVDTVVVSNAVNYLTKARRSVRLLDPIV
jgi:hypothetical protein